MSDNLTLKLKQELEKRHGRAVSDLEVQNFLRAKNLLGGPTPPPVAQQPAVTQEPTQPAQPAQQYPWSTPDFEPDSESKGGALNALGVALWSGLDTAAFGVPGLLVDEEEFLDFEDPMAKYAGAVGGFAGFVAGAPMKLGAKAVQKIATPFIKKTGRESVQEVVRGMKKTGIAEGLDRSTRNQVTKGYQNLVKRSQVDKSLQKEGVLKEKSFEYMNRFIQKGQADGTLTQGQANAIKEMFGQNIGRRPIQDFIGLMAERGIAAGSPRLQRVLGHAINDAVMFGLIDTTFEAVTTIDDHHFDWTAPMWGVANGIAFSQLGWLNPKGKSAKWFPDFKEGIKASFGRIPPYATQSRKHLSQRVNFMGEMLEQSGESYIKTVSHKGIKKQINMKKDADDILKEFKSTWGKDSHGAMVSLLEPMRKKWGREMMKWSTRESFENLGQTWMRMAAGGMLFNARTFAEMYTHDYEPDIHDILPHFLIGAYVQRSSNPARFDLNASRMNKIRSNLMFLGYEPPQLTQIPSFVNNRNRFENAFKDPQMKPILDLLKEKGIITDSNEVAETRLTQGEVSEMQKPNEVFREVYQMATGQMKFMKPLDSISAKDAKEIADAVKKIGPKSGEQLREHFAERNIEVTKDFEREFPDIIERLRKADETVNAEGVRELDILLDPTSAKNSQVPEYLDVSPQLLSRARKGELDFLVDSNGQRLNGDKAVEALMDVQTGVNRVFDTAVALQKTNRIPQSERGPNRSIESEALMREVYKTVTEAENRINEAFPDNSTYADRFSFGKSFNDYVTVLSHNTAIRAGQKVAHLFSGKDAQIRNKLNSLLKESGILSLDPVSNVYKLKESVANIEIYKNSGEISSEDAAAAKRTLNKVLALQSYSGGFEGVAEAPKARIEIGRVKALEKFLAEHGYPVAQLPDWMHPHMVDFIVRDRIKNTKLSVDQVDTMFRLQNHNMSGIELAVEGKTGGFKIKLIDEGIIPASENSPGFEGDIRAYNRYARQLIKDGQGLVKDAGKVKVVDRDFLQGVLLELPTGKADVSSNARAKLTEFLNALPSKFGSFQRQMGEFVKNGNHDMAIRWLTAAGVLSNEGKRKGEYTVHVDKFNETFARQFQKEMNQFGITPEYADRLYAEEAKAARDRFISEADGTSYTKNITLQEFYKRYRFDFDTNDLTRLESKEAQAEFDHLVYQPPQPIVKGQEVQPRRVLKKDAINDMVGRMFVQKDNAWVKFSDLSTRAQNKMKPRVLRDIVGLLSTQRAQEQVRVLKMENGRLEQSFEVQQVNKLSKYLGEKLDMPFFSIDPFAVVYENVDGRYIRTRMENIYRTSENLSRGARERLEGLRTEFEGLLSNAKELHGEKTVGENGEQGVKVMVLAPGLNPIGFQMKDLTRTENNRVHKEFKKLVDSYGANENLSETVREKIREVNERMQNPEVITTTDEYEYALRRLVMKDMLTGSDGNKFFLEFMNGTNAEKTLNRIKLYNTKKFVRADDAFLRDVAEGYREIGDSKTDQAIRRIILNKGFGVAMWNDSQYATVRAEVERIAKQNNIEWNWDTHIGTAHEGTSAFDSISFISRPMMRYVHAVLGHNPNSVNPVKPIISSAGTGAPLLYGKTLFVHSPALEGFFKQNPNLDILTTESASKVYNPGATRDGLDVRMINKPWQNLTGEARPGMTLGQNKIRQIPIDALGLLPSKDANISNAKEGQSNYNFETNAEAGRTYRDNFQGDLTANLERMSFIAKDPIRIREWVLDGKGDEALAPNMAAGEGLANINNLVYFASLSKFANPMSFSENMVQNKMFGSYINSIVNNKYSVTNQFDQANAHRYGGQAFMIQVPEAGGRLKPTLVDSNTGEIKMRGEVMLPAHEASMNIDVLAAQGYEMRFVRGKEVLTGEQVFGKLWKDISVEANLGTIHDALTYEISQGAIPKGTQVGIVTNRKPRTRPNDMSILGLKGFLKDSYGNAIALNSLDVVNVYEGDYDADKADYLFAARRNTYNHVKRASQFFVQGVDPVSLQSPSTFHFGMTPGEENSSIRTMAANAELYKASIGVVQKVPRILGYLSKLGTIDKSTEAFKRTRADGTEYQPRVLLRSGDFKIAIDYENLDFFSRAALETQYIIDGKGRLNENIANDISTWRRDFLFPRFNESVAAGDVAQNNRVGFINEMRTGGNSNGKRVRIFRKFDKDGNEVGLNRLDRAMINEMVNEYSNLLNSTGNSLFEKTGSQRSPQYRDVIEAADGFSNFNKDISTNLYYKMRRKRIDPSAPNSKKWFEDADFNARFGVVEKTYDKMTKWGKPTGEQGKYYISTKKVIPNEVFENGVEFSEGKRGAVIDRIAWQIKDADPFNQLNTHNVTGEARGLMDRWYSSLVGTEADMRNRTDELIHGIRRRSKGDEVAGEVIYSAQAINKKIGFIGNLKRKIAMIGNNKAMTYKSKQVAIEKLNGVIKELEGEIGGYMTEKYKKSRKFKDLKKIEYVSVNEKQVQEGVIQYATMNQIQNILPFSGKDWGLSAAGKKDLADIKKLRKMFYGNKDNLSDVMRFGPDKTTIDSKTIEFLERMPTLSKFGEVETSLIEQGIRRHGIRFLYAFMTPTPNPNAIGVFEGRPVSVPYGATGRYKKGLNILTRIAQASENNRPDMHGMQEFLHKTAEGVELKGTARDLLRINQMVEAHFNRFFTRKFNMKDFVGDAASVELGDGIKFKVDHFKLPDFNESLTGLRGIQWSRNKKRIGNGLNLMNDHLIDFYRDIMKLSGKEKDFDSYLLKMNELQGNMLGMNVIDPMEYLGMRMTMEAEVKNIAKDIITGGIMADRSNPTVKKILSNPVYALMGGQSYFKGLTLEASQPANVNRLKEMTKVFKDLESHSKELNFESRNARERIEQERIKLKEVCKV